MGSSIIVSSSNFATEVVQKSYEKPVLVDFFATWCGPCQILKPMLEKLAQEYDFVLAKVDIDQNPDLANTYRVEGVPDVRVVVQGDIMEGFVGMLPEQEVRDLLTQLNLKSSLELGLAAVQVAKTAGDVAEVKRLYGGLIQRFPENRTLILEMAMVLISQNQLDQAEKLVAHIQEHEKGCFAKAQAVKSLIQFKQDCDRPVINNELDELYTCGARLAVEGQYETAFQTFLELVGRDRKYRNDGARKAMITLFDLLGDEHPLTKQYRKQLMLALY